MANIAESFNHLFSRIMKNADLAFTLALFGTVFLLILPVPPAMMDLLLAASVGSSLLVLLVVLYVKDPPEFSVFPTVLLAVTLYRLGLNVATTRLILLDGYAGDVIQSFGQFVVRGNFVVGLVVFLILVVINFVVITKGSGRIAEVAARFTLDSMPGKQMSIDAELNAGSITEVEANQRREKIQQEADFYGAMDGASKFVRGDAIAGILITLINIVGGILVGVFMKNLSIGDAVQKYTLLSIGDGLVSQIPSLIISVGAGILVTRSNESSNLGEFVGKQLTSYPRAIGILSGMLGVFAIMPGMPFVPFVILSGVTGAGAWWFKQQHEFDQKEAAQEALKKAAKSAEQGRDGKGGHRSKGIPLGQGESLDLQAMLTDDVFAIELGYGLLPLANRDKDGDLISRITGVRRNFAKEMGIIVPPIAIRDNLELETNEYRFLLRNKEIARSMLIPNRWLAMNVNNSDVQLRGVPTVEPVFNLEAVWIQDEEKRTADIHGFTVVDAPSVLITHLQEILKVHAAMLLEREDTQALIDMVKEKNPTLINELLPDLVSVGLIQRVLRNLLKETVPVKNLTLILETIADYATYTKNPDELSERVRRTIGPFFISDYENESGGLQALTLDPRLEQFLITRVQRNQFDVNLMMDPDVAQQMMQQLSMRMDELLNQGMIPILLTTADLRLAFKRFFEPSFPRLVVIAYQEIPPDMKIENIGVISANVPEQIPMTAQNKMKEVPA